MRWVVLQNDGCSSETPWTQMWIWVWLWRSVAVAVAVAVGVSVASLLGCCSTLPPPPPSLFRSFYLQGTPLCAMWTIQCPQARGYAALNVTFSGFSTARPHSELKVYEAVDGPMYTSLSGPAPTGQPLVPDPRCRLLRPSAWH